MKSVAVYIAKTRLSELIAEVESGEQIVITRRGIAVARLVAAQPARRTSAASRRERVAEVFEALRRDREGVSLDVGVRDAIVEARLMPFVLDNSVACGWYLENRANDYTEAVAQRLIDDQAWVPPVWELELANVLRTACVRRRMSAAHAQGVLARLASLPITVDRQPTAPSEILALALRFGLSAFDASYLGLALRMQLPIATQDEPLREAALASGCGLV